MIKGVLHPNRILRAIHRVGTVGRGTGIVEIDAFGADLVEVRVGNLPTTFEGGHWIVVILAVVEIVIFDFDDVVARGEGVKVNGVCDACAVGVCHDQGSDIVCVGAGSRAKRLWLVRFRRIAARLARSAAATDETSNSSVVCWRAERAPEHVGCWGTEQFSEPGL